MRVPRWLIIPLCIVGILYWTQDLWDSGNSQASIFDLPKKVENENFTIIVYPVSNVNGVPVFTTGTSGNEDDYLYITPASDSVDFPTNYAEKRDSGYTLQLHGSYFMGKGIPAEYFNVKPKPDRLRVFRFDEAEMVVEKNGI